MNSEAPYIRFDPQESQSGPENKDDGDDDCSSVGSFHSCDGGSIYISAKTEQTSGDGSSNFSKIVPLIKEITGSNIPWAMYVFCLSAAFFIAIYIINKQKPTSTVAEILLSVFMLIGCYGQIVCLLMKKNQRFVTFITLEDRHSNHYLMTGVYIFGCSTLLAVLLRLHMYFHASNSVYNCQSGIFSNKSIDHVFKNALTSNKNGTSQPFIGIFCYTDIIYDFIRLLFTLFQVVFLQCFHTATFAESIKIKFLLYHTMLTNICIWIKYVVQESHLFNEITQETLKNFDPAMHRCIQFNEILTPFILEYSLIVAGILYEISGQMKTYPIQQSLEESDGEQTERGLKMSKPLYDLLTSKTSQSASGAQPGLIIGVLFGLMIVSSCVSFDQANDRSTVRSLTLFTTYEGFVFIVQLGVLAAMVSQLRFHVRHADQTQPDEVLLFIGLIGTFSFSVIGTYTNIVCCARKLHSGTFYISDIITTIQLLINMIAQLFQAFVIQFSRRYFPDPDNTKSRESAGKTRQLTLFLLMINLSIWAQDSFIEIRNSARNTFPCGPVVFEDNWDMIVAITYPFAIFYRFHSAAMLFEFWRRFKYYHKKE